MVLENLPYISGEKAVGETDKFLFFPGQEYLVEVIANLIGFVGLFVMVFGVVKSLLLFLKLIFNRHVDISQIRLDLGSYLILALEFLIAKDILESIFNPSLATLTELLIIVVIRTILTHFLNKELTQVKQEINEELVRTNHTTRKSSATNH